MKGIHLVAVLLSLFAIIYGIAIKDLYSKVTPGLNVGDYVHVLNRTDNPSNPTNSRAYEVYAVGDGWVDLGPTFRVKDPNIQRFPTGVWVSVTENQISQMTKLDPEKFDPGGKVDEHIRPAQDG